MPNYSPKIRARHTIYEPNRSHRTLHRNENRQRANWKHHGIQFKIKTKIRLYKWDSLRAGIIEKRGTEITFTKIQEAASLFFYINIYIKKLK